MESTQLILSVDESGLELDAAAPPDGFRQRQIPRSKVSRIADRDLGTDDELRAEKASEGIGQSQMSDVAKRLATGEVFAQRSRPTAAANLLRLDTVTHGALPRSIRLSSVVEMCVTRATWASVSPAMRLAVRSSPPTRMRFVSVRRSARSIRDSPTHAIVRSGK
jgi:hypothetical protein